MRHVAITGASSGIGRAIALRLAREGDALSLFGRRADELALTAQAAMDRGSPRALALKVDVRVRPEVDESFSRAAAELGPIDVLIANAGVGGPNQPGPSDRFEELVQSNLQSAYHCARAAQRHLSPGPSTRHIVFMSSILGRIGVAGYTGYCASKAGLLGLTRALACELASSNVQVNAVCPGWVDTAMAREGLKGMADSLRVSPEKALTIAMQEVPLGRMGEPEEIAGLVRWLVSEDSRGVTGQGIDVNGGAFMH